MAANARFEAQEPLAFGACCAASTDDQTANHEGLRSRFPSGVAGIGAVRLVLKSVDATLKPGDRRSELPGRQPMSRHIGADSWFLSPNTQLHG